MIRIFFVVFFLFWFLVLTIPIQAFEAICRKKNKPLADKISLACVKWAFRCCIFFAGVDVTYIGEQNIPRDKAVLFVANHSSYFDILLTYVRAFRTTGYIAKAEMQKAPLLNNWMRYIGCVFLDRKDIKKGMKAIIESVNKIKAGDSLYIFPEGTRSKQRGVIGEFHEGSLKIADKAKCPIVPVAILNTFEIWEAHLPKIHKAKVIIEYGKPIYPGDLDANDKKKLGAYTRNIIEQMNKKNEGMLD